MVIVRLLFVMALAGAGFAVWYWSEQQSPRAAEAISLEEFEGLNVAKQKEIWDLEHATFEIETHVGKRISRALVERSVEDLTACFRPNFAGSYPRAESGTRVEQAGVLDARRTAADGDAGCDRAAFCEHLASSLASFEAVDSARFKVLKIRQSGKQDGTPLWQLELLLSAKGQGEGGGPAMWESRGRALCQFSGDDEIKAGRILERWEIVTESLRIAREPLMEEVTSRVGLDQVPIQDNWTTPVGYVRQYIFQSAVEDYDLDGDLDIAAATANGQCFLLQQHEGSYRQMASEAGVLQEGENELRSYLATWLDFDNDGDPDLLLGSQLYRNLGGGSFEPVADNGGLRLAYNPMGAVVADYDADGLLDVYILYQRTRDGVRTKTPAWVGDDQSGAPNQLWRNVGNGRFEDVTEAAGASGGTRHTFAACWLHADDDRYPDLYVANDFGENTLLINRGGRFRDATKQAGVGDFATSMGVASGDIDDDGSPEIYVANMFSKMGRRILAQVSAADYPPGIYEQMLGSCAGNRLYRRSPDETRYREHSEALGINEVGWAYAPAFADFDGDGDLDIYATAGFISADRSKPDG